jgi:hypothetical protein
MQNDCLQLNEYSKAGAKTFPPDFRMGQKRHSGEALLSGVLERKTQEVIGFLIYQIASLLCIFFLNVQNKSISPTASHKEE